MISDERIERAARAMCQRKGEDPDRRYSDSQCFGGVRAWSYYKDDARAALAADAPEIAAAEMRGLEMAREALIPFSWVFRHVDDRITGKPDMKSFARDAMGLKVSAFRRAAYALEAIDARVAELKAKTEPGSRFTIVDVGTTDIIGKWW